MSVRLHDELLHLLYSKLVRDHTGNLEESRLQDSIGTVTKTNLLSDLSSVDHIEVDLILSEVPLHLIWKVLLYLIDIPDTIE
ncbi:Uncharacterised protein [Chlamydia trachomatis]|nr:Uncharacterised protein [Chlamydia trachomatis]